MLNFLGALSSLLPGYVQGRRQAIQDNWQDLNNYNNVQAGQLSNAFTEATWQPRLDMFADQAINSGLNTLVNGMNTATHAARFPGDLYTMYNYSMFAPTQSYQDNLMKILAQRMLMGNQDLFRQSLFPQQQGMNPAPSSTQQLGG